MHRLLLRRTIRASTAALRRWTSTHAHLASRLRSRWLLHEGLHGGEGIIAAMMYGIDHARDRASKVAVFLLQHIVEQREPIGVHQVLEDHGVVEGLGGKVAVHVRAQREPPEIVLPLREQPLALV